MVLNGRETDDGERAWADLFDDTDDVSGIILHATYLPPDQQTRPAAARRVSLASVGAPSTIPRKPKSSGGRGRPIVKEEGHVQSSSKPDNGRHDLASCSWVEMIVCYGTERISGATLFPNPAPRSSKKINLEEKFPGKHGTCITIAHVTRRA